ncbi:hypothetical protein GIB67_041073 [Kingdonia uniflora]|uniref:Uncharacterized protein n=1 Tax=Kingdonia uniflora TaxID=39325 RepID=A0A7J7LK03_9MAGN|nr:hypothetical protein GIB67_041073 [Kingdonia uniflora]
MNRRRASSLTLTFNNSNNNTDEKLDLFSRNRRSLSLASSDDSDNVSMKWGLGRLSLGSIKLSSNTSSNMDDLLFSADGGKNDYDWLLTPPGTPLLSEASEPQTNLGAPRSSSFSRSVSTTKASRLSVSQSENNQTSRPARSSSVTRPSISTVNYNTYSSNSYRSPSSILNTSSASITSLIRPSTPGARSNLTSTTRPSPPSARSVSSRPSTPVKSRPNLTSSSGEKTRGSLNARPSTPTSRPLVPANMNFPSSRSNSQPSTPTRRNPTQGTAAITSRPASVGRVVTNGRVVTSTSRGTSPSPRARGPAQPVVPPDFPLNTPPNLRTTLPDRPVSAGRSRSSAPGTVKGASESTGPINRRQSSSPIVTRGRVPEVSGKGRSHANGQGNGTAEYQRTPPSSESTMRRPAKPATATESTGFGRTISKKSLDMALRHMDIRNGSGCIRPLSGSNLFPQSIRSGNSKGQLTRSSNSPVSVSSNGGSPTSSTIAILENGSYNDRYLDGSTEEDHCRLSAKLVGQDIYESTRYDAIMLKEDLKNTNWLHSLDDQDLVFDHRFEPLPELFDPL